MTSFGECFADLSCLDLEPDFSSCPGVAFSKGGSESATEVGQDFMPS